MRNLSSRSCAGRSAAGRTVPAALVSLAALAVCAPAWAFPWPWHHHRAAARPTATATVHAIAVSLEGGAGAAIGQSWDRNTLLLDLTGQGGQGEATLTRLPDAGWPLRLEFRVRPGAIARLTVQGAQRVEFSVPAQGAPLTLKLDPGVYVTDTTRITLRWSAAGD
jgi:hypothetical protein